MRNQKITSLSALSAATLAVAGLTFGAAPVVHAQEPAAETTPIVVNGLIETNITFNLNKPSSRNNTYIYNNKEGQFALNLAQIQISKAVNASNRAGFKVRLVEGEIASGLNFAAADSTNVLEAYGTLLIPLGGKELTFDAGQFVTHVGYETIEIGSNNFFSRNWLFQYPSPFYNAGVRAAYPVNDKVTFTGYIYNRYNGRVDTGNRDLAPGFQILANISPKSQFILNGLASRENLNAVGVAPNNKQQNVLDVVYSNQFADSFKFVFEGLYRFGKDATDDDYDTFGVAGYFIFPFKNGNTFAVRAETLKQNDLGDPVYPTYPNAADAAKKFEIGSVTAAYEIKSNLFAGSKTILEYRYDFAGKDFFTTKDDFKKNQSTITIGQVFNF